MRDLLMVSIPIHLLPLYGLAFANKVCNLLPCQVSLLVVLVKILE